MPPGPLWTLRYENTVDDRIQARVDRARFEQDEFVLSTTLILDPPDPNPGSTNPRYYRLNVRMANDREGPEAYALHDLYERRRPFTERTVVGFQNLLGPPDTPNRNGDMLSPEARESIISQFINSSEGRSRLAASMIAPLRARIDYSSVARRTFLVDQIPEGALPVYDRDPDPGAMATLRSGLIPEVSMGCSTSTEPWVRPEWLKLDQWVTRNGEFARIIKVEMLNVEFQVWRSFDPPRRQIITSFAREWAPCDEPKEPESRFSRILFDDD